MNAIEMLEIYKMGILPTDTQNELKEIFIMLIKLELKVISSMNKDDMEKMVKSATDMAKLATRGGGQSG